ncbi:serine/threonine protein phosphatase [Mycobacterium phage Settecandela]|nr:serine/threonine protein phosphatase [Mycobacterium phage Settecandela]
MTPADTLKWPHDDVLHAWWVQPGLLAGEYPGASALLKTRLKLNLLLNAGVRTFIDLTHPTDGLTRYDGVLAELAKDRGIEVTHYRHPIIDNWVTSNRGYDRILERIDTEAAAGRTTYVHCWGGKGRTSTVVGCLLANEGMSYDEVIARIAALRAGTRKVSEPCPQDISQHRLLKQRCRPGRRR